MSLKDEIRTELERGEEISGQMLGDRLGVSRNAVWKAINTLRQEGYEIESTTRRGYRLAADCDKLSQAAIQQAIRDASVSVYVYDEVDSTNTEAKRLLTQGVEGSFLVVSDQQTGGRGRRGRAFFSPKGSGLYMTLALTQAWELRDAVGVTAFTALCVARAIQRVCNKDPQIKWVNDLYVDGKKVCGILTEAVTDVESGSLDALLIGIGVNVRACELPEELRPIVGFLNCEGRVRNQLAAEITNELMLYDPKRPLDVAEYKQRSMVLGKSVRFTCNGAWRDGKAVDVNVDGGLIVETPEGLETLRSGEITLRVVPEATSAPDAKPAAPTQS